MSEINMDELEQEFAEALDGTGRDEPVAVQEQPTPQELEAEDGRLRNPETGQFETPGQRQERLYGGKYKSVEDLEAGYQNAEQKIGAMGNELGQWRQWAEYQAQQQAQAQQAQQFDEEKLSQWDEYSLEKPFEAAQLALQQDNQILYERTMDNWYAEDPKSAARFERAVEIQWQQIQMAQRMQPLMAQQQEQAQLSAYMAVRQRHPDLDQFGDGIALAANVNKFLLPVLQHGTQQEKEQALETLYFMARGMTGLPQAQQPPPPSQASGQPATGLVQSGQQRPYVASPSQIPSGTGPARSPQEAFIDELWNQGLENG